jgi:hypothetical protein
VSNESGQNEVYVRPLEGSGEKFQISTDGGEEPAWARSGNQLFYRNGAKMMAVEIATKPAFHASRPVLLFSGLYYFNITPNRAYDVTADGRFVMVQEPDFDNAPRQVNVVLGWTDELKQRVPRR